MAVGKCRNNDLIMANNVMKKQICRLIRGLQCRVILYIVQ